MASVEDIDQTINSILNITIEKELENFEKYLLRSFYKNASNINIFTEVHENIYIHHI